MCGSKCDPVNCKPLAVMGFLSIDVLNWAGNLIGHVAKKIH